MVAIVVHVLLLEGHGGVVVVVEDRLARLEDRDALPVDAGGVEEYGRAGRAGRPQTSPVAGGRP